MATRKVADLVRGLAQEPDVARALRTDALALTRRFGLSPGDRAALGDADRFFKTEQPITTAVKPARAAAPVAADAAPRLVPAAGVRGPLPRPVGLAAAFTASADTGTLLPGPDTGTFSDPLTGTAPATPAPGPAPAPAPAPGVPAAPGPAPSAPAVPAGPAPGSPGPAIPGWPPGWPQPVPGPWPAQGGPARVALPCGNPAQCNQEAIVAIVAMANATSQTAIAAITALANRKKS